MVPIALDPPHHRQETAGAVDAEVEHVLQLWRSGGFDQDRHVLRQDAEASDPESEADLV